MRAAGSAQRDGESCRVSSRVLGPSFERLPWPLLRGDAKRCGYAEIGDPDVPLVIEENIVGFEITVDNPTAMNVLDCEDLGMRE